MRQINVSEEKQVEKVDYTDKVFVGNKVGHKKFGIGEVI